VGLEELGVELLEVEANPPFVFPSDHRNQLVDQRLVEILVLDVDLEGGDVIIDSLSPDLLVLFVVVFGIPCWSIFDLLFVPVHRLCLKKI